MTFDPGGMRVFPIRTGQQQPSQRVKLIGRLGSARIPFQVDIGFGDVIVPGPEEVQFPTLLQGMAAPSVQAYPRASSVAEKFEAIVQLGQQNSRMKDFHDIWALSETFSFDGSVLSDAIQACFARRRTDWTTLEPLALTPAFYTDARLNRRWSDYRTSTNPLIPPPDTVPVVGERIATFLTPIRESVLEDLPFDMDWSPGGPWRVQASLMERQNE